MRGLVAGLTILALIVAIAIVVLGSRRSPGETDLLRIADELTRVPATGGGAFDPADYASADEEEPVDSFTEGERSRVDSAAETEPAPEEARREQTAPSISRDRADLHVLVVDPSGQALAGVPVELMAGDERFADEPVRTDENGEATLEDARAWIGSRSTTLRHDLPFAEVPELALDEARLAEEVIVSQLPPFGALFVSVIEPDGLPSAQGTLTGIGIVAEEEREDPSVALERHIWEHDLTDGRTRIDFVELGREWEVRAWLEGSDVISRTRVHGPVNHGQEVEAVVERGKNHPVLSYRVLREDGSPIRNAKIEVKRYQFIQAVEVGLQTDEHGYFRIDVPKKSLFGGKEIVVTRHPKKGAKLTGKASFPDAPEPGLNECGNIVLSPDQLLVSGQVIEPSGKPVRGAKVVAGTNTLEGFVWDNRGSVADETDDEGRFALHGFLLDSPFDLRAGKGKRRTDEIKVETGQTGVVLILEERCNLSGTLRVPEGFNPGAVHFELLLQESEQRQDFSSRNLDSSGSFEMGTVPPGVYMLRFQLANELLHEMRNVLVQDDTDVGEIDLRGKLALFRLELVGGEGKPRGDLAWKKGGDDESEWQGESFEGRDVVLSTLSGPLDVRVHPEGYRQAMLEGAQHFARIPLERPLSVRLELETTEPLPKLPYLFDPELKVDDVKVGTPIGARYFTDENRSVLFDVGVAGKIEVAWHLEKRGENWATGGEVLHAHRVQIEVLDVPGTQTFTLRLKEGVLKKLTEKPPF